jgi:hypothetical protein
VRRERLNGMGKIDPEIMQRRMRQTHIERLCLLVDRCANQKPGKPQALAMNDREQPAGNCSCLAQ